MLESSVRVMARRHMADARRHGSGADMFEVGGAAGTQIGTTTKRILSDSPLSGRNGSIQPIAAPFKIVRGEP